MREYANQIRNKTRRRVSRAQPTVRCRRAPVPSGPGVYFIRSGFTVKIGFGADLQRRLQSLQAGTYRPLCIVGYIPMDTPRGAQRLEHDLHRQFRDERQRGEWFRLTEPIVDTIRRRGIVDDRALLL